MANGITQVVRKFDPELIAFGGGISKAFDLFGISFIKTLGDNGISGIEIYAEDEHGNQGIFGAAYFALLKARS